MWEGVCAWGWGCIRGLWNELWGINRGLNVAMFPAENSSWLAPAIRGFLEFMKQLELLEILFSGEALTSCGGQNGLSMSRLDHFLSPGDWEDHFLKHGSVYSAQKSMLDHFFHPS